ncbi:ubiquitin carboxyl-terminal hydrolase 17-like [Curcuma longa]|uniref:ubiquitin carboxyl-terminal hydrolase 17-like n=1 Tax=Curcuma longa TaxID=136217 RepID=UPI003D9F0FA5
MPLEVYLRISWAPLVVFLVGPVLAFVVQRRWRLAMARQEEVRRLAFLAAQETIQAEAEAMKAYVATSAAAMSAEKESPVWPPECPVCFGPAMARCGQCKAVRYCSGKCQIIHWRQGHKDECHPPIVNDSNTGAVKAIDSEPAVLEKRYVPKEELNTKAVESPERPSALKPTSPDDFKDKPEENTSVEFSAKESISASFSASSIASGSALSNRILDGPLNGCNPNPVLDARLGETSSSDTPTTNPRTGADTYDANHSVLLIPELTRSNPSANITPKVKSQAEQFLPKLSADKLSANDKAKSVASPRSSEISSEKPVTLSNSVAAIANATSVSTKSSEPAAPTLVEVKSQTDHNETPASNLEASDTVANGTIIETQSLICCTLRSLPFASNQLSYSSGGQTITSSERLEIGNALRGSIRTDDDACGATLKGLSTPVKAFLKQPTSHKTSRNYPPELMLFPFDLFIKLYNPSKIQLHPCGLANNGNSCYANAVLQCLAFTRPLSAYLLEGLHSLKCPKKAWCFTCELESLVMHTKQGQSPLSPRGVLSHLHNMGKNFSPGQQQDAHEFFRYAVDVMQSECLKEAGANPESVLAVETTLIQQTFGGYLLSKIRCNKCKVKSKRYERMMDLTLEIHGDIATLDEALLCFTSPEILDGENKYDCSRCKSYERARKRLMILEAPNILTIVLKRFKSGQFGKLNKSVQFPEYLNLARYMSGDDASPVYQLYAAIVHKDVRNSTSSGHYVCYVKDTQSKWYKINDSKVKTVELEKVLSKGPYILLYARCLPRAPRSVRKAMACDTVPPRKTSGKEAKGKPVGSCNMEESKDLPKQQIKREDDNFTQPDQFDKKLCSPTDSSSDSSSLFDEGSSCSTESTRESTSTEENSGELDFINPNNPSSVP